MASPKPKFKPSVSAETAFSRALKKVAKISGHLVETHVDGHEIKNPKEMTAALTAYSKTIGPWAEKQAAKMLAKVSRANKTSYSKAAKEIGKGLTKELEQEPVGQVARALMREQVELIKSIPLRAAERAQKLAMEAVINGTRASEVADMLQKATSVSESDAIRIARTEVARATASFNQARSQQAGSSGYRWRNSGDGAVRDSHKMWKGKKLEGQYFRWDSPPTLDDGTIGHPGTFVNCRCYAESEFDE